MTNFIYLGVLWQQEVTDIAETKLCSIIYNSLFYSSLFVHNKTTCDETLCTWNQTVFVW